jgi:hypothetical protein
MPFGGEISSDSYQLRVSADASSHHGQSCRKPVMNASLVSVGVRPVAILANTVSDAASTSGEARIRSLTSDTSRSSVLTHEVVFNLQRTAADLTDKGVPCHSLKEDYAQITKELCVRNVVADILGPVGIRAIRCIINHHAASGRVSRRSSKECVDAVNAWVCFADFHDSKELMHDLVPNRERGSRRVRPWLVPRVQRAR